MAYCIEGSTIPQQHLTCSGIKFGAQGVGAPKLNTMSYAFSHMLPQSNTADILTPVITTSQDFAATPLTAADYYAVSRNAGTGAGLPGVVKASATTEFLEAQNGGKTFKVLKTFWGQVDAQLSIRPKDVDHTANFTGLAIINTLASNNTPGSPETNPVIQQVAYHFDGATTPFLPSALNASYKTIYQKDDIIELAVACVGKAVNTHISSWGMRVQVLEDLNP